MKRILATLLAVMMIATLCVVFVSARGLDEEAGWTAHTIFDATLKNGDGSDIEVPAEYTHGQVLGDFQLWGGAGAGHLFDNKGINICNNATVTITFKGTGLQIGTCYRPTTAPSENCVTVTVDGKDATSKVTSVDQWSAPEDGSHVTPTVMFKVEGLEAGEHTVVMTSSHDASWRFNLDWYKVKDEGVETDPVDEPDEPSGKSVKFTHGDTGYHCFYTWSGAPFGTNFSFTVWVKGTPGQTIEFDSEDYETNQLSYTFKTNDWEKVSYTLVNNSDKAENTSAPSLPFRIYTINTAGDPFYIDDLTIGGNFCDFNQKGHPSEWPIGGWDDGVTCSASDENHTGDVEAVATLEKVVMLEPEENASTVTIKYYFSADDCEAWAESANCDYTLWWGFGPQGRNSGDCSACVGFEGTSRTYGVEDGCFVITITGASYPNTSAADLYEMAKEGELIAYICELTQVPPFANAKDNVIEDGGRLNLHTVEANTDITATQYSASGLFDGVVLPIEAELSASTITVNRAEYSEEFDFDYEVEYTVENNGDLDGDAWIGIYPVSLLEDVLNGKNVFSGNSYGSWCRVSLAGSHESALEKGTYEVNHTDGDWGDFVINETDLLDLETEYVAVLFECDTNGYKLISYSDAFTFEDVTPEETEPEETEPEETEPEETEPEETEPEETEPKETEPKETAPAETDAPVVPTPTGDVFLAVAAAVIAVAAGVVLTKKH